MKKLLVIQFINGVAQDHEFSVIIDKARVSPEQALAWDIFSEDDSDFWNKQRESVGAIIIGGSPHSVYDAAVEKEIKIFERVLHDAILMEIPVLGICFGHQAICQALGGVVQRDEDRQEKGFARVHQRPEGAKDPIFQHLPESFVSRVNHADHVFELPEQTVHLCYNDTSAVQAFRHKEKPVWGVQFHPEMSEEDVLFRYNAFSDTYFASEEEKHRAHQRTMATSPEVHDVLAHFWTYAQRER